jgi:hypothetical protein
METVECETSEELEKFFKNLAPGVLFRGQTKEYSRADGGPDIRTSFDRHGCVPPRMLKWWHYSRAILSTYVKGFDGLTDLATDQAILQHYGWRSFFLDSTTDPSVACWFAGNSYRSERSAELIEDCFEDPLFVLRQTAWYEPADERSCVYVLNRKALRAHDLQTVDLVEITTAAGRHRCLAQAAFMVGPLNGFLPDDCISARVYARSSLFRSYAAQFPEMTCEALFPGPAVDPVMAALLSIPWVKRQVDDSNTGKDIDFFDRGLPLPEYEVRGIRRTGSSTAYYRRFWLADAARLGMPFADTTFFLTQEALYHGSASGELLFPHLTRLLRERTSIAVEIDGLVRHPYAGRSAQYGKGIYLEALQDGVLFVTELVVDHPGTRPSGFGITRGCYFRADKRFRWHKIEHPEQCDCGRPTHHAHHLVIAEHFEHALKERKFNQIRERVFAAADVDARSDSMALQWLE